MQPQRDGELVAHRGDLVGPRRGALHHRAAVARFGDHREVIVRLDMCAQEADAARIARQETHGEDPLG